MDTVIDIALILTPVIVAVGFFFGYRQLVSARNARMAAIIMRIAERWDSTDMRKSRHKVNQCGNNLKNTVEQADSSDSESLYEFTEVANFFDTLGLLVMEGFLDCSMGYELFGRAEEHYYDLYRPILDQPRYSEYLKNFGRLHEVFKAEAARRSKAKPRRPA